MCNKRVRPEDLLVDSPLAIKVVFGSQGSGV